MEELQQKWLASQDTIAHLRKLRIADEMRLNKVQSVIGYLDFIARK